MSWSPEECVPMTVGELRLVLADLADDVPVFVDGYEDGLCRPVVRRDYVGSLVGDPDQPSYYGPWETVYVRGTPERDVVEVWVVGR